MNNYKTAGIVHKPLKKTGIVRIWGALIYSLEGLRFAYVNGAAFRQLTLANIIASVVLIFLPISLVSKCILFFAASSILVVELLNFAIESVVDLASPEYHDLAKCAKDLASAAVLISIAIAIILWILLLSFNIA